jgi:SAM-dependent methyltransferase
MTQITNVSSGYAVLSDGAPVGGLATEGWCDGEVAATQHAAFQPLLDELRQGRPRRDFQVAADAVRATGLERPTVLEVGCGSGYYAEVFRLLLNGGLVYEGADVSPAMIDLARQTQPGIDFHVADACSLPFESGRFDVVFNGVSLMHIPEWRKAVAEARRVSRRFVVLHTVPLLRHRATTWMTKNAYGRPCVEIIFNEAELLGVLAAAGLRVVQSWPSLVYDLRSVLGESTPTATFLTEIQS